MANDGGGVCLVLIVESEEYWGYLRITRNIEKPETSNSNMWVMDRWLSSKSQSLHFLSLYLSLSLSRLLSSHLLSSHRRAPDRRQIRDHSIPAGSGAPTDAAQTLGRRGRSTHAHGYARVSVCAQIFCVSEAQIFCVHIFVCADYFVCVQIILCVSRLFCVQIIFWGLQNSLCFTLYHRCCLNNIFNIFAHRHLFWTPCRVCFIHPHAHRPFAPTTSSSRSTRSRSRVPEMPSI